MVELLARGHTVVRTRQLEQIQADYQVLDSHQLS